MPLLHFASVSDSGTLYLDKHDTNELLDWTSTCSPSWRYLFGLMPLICARGSVDMWKRASWRMDKRQPIIVVSYTQTEVHVSNVIPSHRSRCSAVCFVEALGSEDCEGHTDDIGIGQ